MQFSVHIRFVVFRNCRTAVIFSVVSCIKAYNGVSMTCFDIFRKLSSLLYYIICGKNANDKGRGENCVKRYLSFYRGEITDTAYDGICHDNDYVWTKGCEDLIRKAKADKPIFAFLGLNNPHLPYHAERNILTLLTKALSHRQKHCQSLKTIKH